MLTCGIVTSTDKSTQVGGSCGALRLADVVEQLTHILNPVGDLSPALAHLDRQYRDVLAPWEKAQMECHWYASIVS